MAKEPKGFVIYGDIQEVVNRLSREEAGDLLKGMLEYFNTGKEPKFKGVLEFVFIPIRQQMDRDSDKYEAKCERMRENAQKRWQNAIASKSNQLDANDANTNTNINTNTKTKINTNTKPPESGDSLSLSSELIRYLNEKAGTSHKVTDSFSRRISELTDAGYQKDAMIAVIDKKCAEWLNDEKMRSYLRPSTLFGDKFGEYLAAPVSLAQEREKDKSEKMAALRKQLEEKQTALADLRDSLRDADPTERRIRREQIAMLEDSIDLIEGRLV